MISIPLTEAQHFALFIRAADPQENIDLFIDSCLQGKALHFKASDINRLQEIIITYANDEDAQAEAQNDKTAKNLCTALCNLTGKILKEQKDLMST
jgi:hypothetical protein